MPLYLYQIAYTPESLARNAEPPGSLGGRGQATGRVRWRQDRRRRILWSADVAAIVEAADDTTMAAVALAIAAGGAAKAAKTTPLLSGAQWVAAMQKAPSITYRPAR